MYRILHVEDDKDYADMIQLHLQRCSRRRGEGIMQFVTVETVSRARDNLIKDAYDCIICDHQLPDGSGLDVLSIYKNSDLACPIIFLTGQGDEQVARNAFVNGVDDYFSKDMGLAGYEKLFHSIMTHMRLTALRDRAMAATKALHEKERLAETYLDIASALIVSLDTGGNVTMVNKYGQELFFDKGMIGMSLLSCVPDADLPTAKDILVGMLHGDFSEPCECIFPLVDRYGGTHQIQWNILPHKDSEGMVTGLLCSGQDITEKAIAQALLLQERNKFLSVLEALQIGVYIIDSSYNIEYVNPAMISFFGHPDKMKCYEYLHKLSSPCPDCPNKRVFEGHVVTRDNYYSHLGKKFSLTELPIFNDDGTMSKLELFYPDSSED